MKWIQVKMDQLGVSGNLNYKIAFMLDSKAMISVFAEQYGVVEVRKRLQLGGLNFPLNTGFEKAWHLFITGYL